MATGVRCATVWPERSVVTSTKPMARSLWAVRRWAKTRTQAQPRNKSSRLATRVRVRYKFIALINCKHEKPMQVNDKAPDFSLANEEGKNVSLKDLRGKDVVLFFYPKANTPG